MSKMKLQNIKEGKLVEVSETRDWYAWINLMPPAPYMFHVIGEVQVPNLGVKAFLVPRVPQGFNPAILLMDLILVQKPGYWPQVTTWVEARYDKVVQDSLYESVEIFSGSDSVTSVNVEEVQ